LYAGHVGVDEEPEWVLELVPFHQPVQRLLAELGEFLVAGVAGQAGCGDLQRKRVVALGEQDQDCSGEPFRVAAGQ
jgi:hypothetical protein